jgi:hypothetical protein
VRTQLWRRLDILPEARANCKVHGRVRGQVLVAQEHQPLPSEPVLARFRAHGSPRAATSIS